TEAHDASPRRCAQHVMYVILDLLVRGLAPIAAVTCDDVWEHMRAAGWVTEPSVHLAAWPKAPAAALDAAGQARWARFRAVRDAVMKALEEQRIARVIGSPLEARVTLVADAELARLVRAHQQTLAEAFVVSEVDVREDGAGSPGTDVPGLRQVVVARAAGAKCARCWKHLMSVGTEPAHPALCDRCARVVATTTV
ncbi:MAG: class I tRNA ligase family protein, partial [Dehalococcoidia bacterium]|nr:class I tRNA ligase family protein [Dehalococcoidia bacterium]